METIVQLCSMKNTCLEGTDMSVVNCCIPKDRLVGVMLMNTILTQQEGDHMARCEACHELMVQETVRVLSGQNAMTEELAGLERL